jgi:hypothetical protein
LLHSVFLQSHQSRTSALRLFSAIAATPRAVRLRRARQAHARCAVNTSLSETLFFSSCWCIRDEVHSIPECTQRLKPSHTSEGNMAKKAKKAKAKKAKSAVKKTAKKTRKVAKKKK